MEATVRCTNVPRFKRCAYVCTRMGIVIDVNEALVVAIYGASHAGPRLGDTEVPLHVTLSNYLILKLRLIINLTVGYTLALYIPSLCTSTYVNTVC